MWKFIILIIAILVTGCDDTEDKHILADATDTTTSVISIESSDLRSQQPLPTGLDQIIITGSQISNYQSCASELIKVTDVAVRDYFWSETGDFLYFTYDEVDWWSYEVESGAVQKIYNMQVPYPGHVPDYVVGFFPNAIPQYNLFVSPSNAHAIYSDYINTGPVNTPQAEGESAPSPYPVYQDIYYLVDGTASPFLFDRIQGAIQRIIWSPDETLAIMEMNMRTPFPPGTTYFWLLEVAGHRITPLFTVDPASQETPAVWCISPNNQWILYTSSDDIYFSIRNLESGIDLTLDLQLARWARWLDDNRHILSVGSYDYDDELSSYSVYIYDIYTRQATRLLDQELRISIWRDYALTFSPSTESLAYIREESEELFLINFCLDPLDLP